MATDQTGALTMPLEPPDYDDTSIRRLRPPEVEGSRGDWTSRWLLRLREDPDHDSLADASDRLSRLEGLIEVSVTALGRAEIRVETRSSSHPLDPESYLWIDALLIDIDSSLGGIVEINGSPRDWWRTFRGA